MKRHGLLLIVFLSLISGVYAQLPGVDRHGAVRAGGDVFVNRYGERVAYPSLNQYGQDLHYAPLVKTDSVKLSETSVTTALFYGEVVFDGWSPVLSRGFDYAVTQDFSGSQRTVCTAGEGQMSSVVTGLSYNQQYYVRAFASNRYGTSFADTFSFHTDVGPVAIESVQAEVGSPYSFDVVVRLGERGGLPVSGNIDVFTDEECQDRVATEPIVNLTSNQVVKSFSGLAPATIYYARTVLTNGLFSDTVFSQVRTPSDLVLSIESGKAASISLCSGGTPVTYKAVLSGSDRNRANYDFLWTVTTGDEAVHDTAFTVLYETVGTYGVTVKAFYGEDTIVARVDQVIKSRSGTSSFYVCASEFLNTAEATTTNIASIRWIDEHGETVATTNSVKLPTGYYTVECTDIFGCVLSKEEYVGKKKLSCIVTDSLGSNESGHFEDGVWKLDSVQDNDGNWYAVTQIGTQCWTRQNCRTRHAPSDGLDLWNGGNETRTLHYVDYNPETLPHDGACYNWAAAMDTAVSPMDNSFDFYRKRRGLCPLGWHIPQYEETWDMIEAVYNICCEGVEPTPPLRVFQTNVATNAPMAKMLQEQCYESMTNPEYPEEIYDASHLSLLQNPASGYLQFWIGNCPKAGKTSYVLRVNDRTGMAISSTGRERGNVYVRCVRGYP